MTTRKDKMFSVFMSLLLLALWTNFVALVIFMIQAGWLSHFIPWIILLVMTALVWFVSVLSLPIIANVWKIKWLIKLVGDGS
ncbi:hypothetical protein COT97_00310 [Candidatus Falkowbacteria bacterium CG10_big_fil_rev_8_21_14_0_10_39_11]|uniref:Uncharacterized protein n=1 Tax=Candidatus Falkowbacteria bacterium CG10_big_fil_rev_8_21_14_0_10_39_11 TaxID=1974565 RepID=A0A2H0V8B0_9BACT|nr:MAG: hypothetical protein COT97_00310 [Candidatus Falkowbacteria bacterium CG10_big_fil_rev_8_21_14_0_10_39_11]